MDDQDFQSLARSYAYDQRAFLIALRRAGLTSLAVQEELGGQVSSSPSAAVYAGNGVARPGAAHRLPRSRLSRSSRCTAFAATRCNLVAYDAATAARYARQLPLKFSRRAVRVLRPTLPVVYAIRTQADYFGTVRARAPRRPPRARARARPRARSAAAERRALPGARRSTRWLHDAIDRNHAHTVVFFGLRNQVLGYPDNIDATAERDARRQPETSARSKRTTSSRTKPATSRSRRTCRIKRYASKRSPSRNRTSSGPRRSCSATTWACESANVRAVYLRPFAHQGRAARSKRPTSSSLREIAQGVRAAGLRVGPASPFDRFETPLVGDRARIAGRTRGRAVAACSTSGSAIWRWGGRLRRGRRPAGRGGASPFTMTWRCASCSR